jgi:ABC-type branched-subunit amino acid transport system substrate-binding protein
MNMSLPHSGRSRYGAAVLAIGVVIALVLTGCSSSKSTSGGSSSAGGSSAGGSGAPTSAAVSGDPIKVMTIAAVNYNGPSYANINTTAKLAGQWFNSHGGINGRPIQVTTCDEQGDPNKLANCGRQAVADKDVAVIGSFTLNADAIMPILTAANISWFGICCAVAASELTSSNVQQIGSGLSLIVGDAVKAYQDGCKKIALVTGDAGALTTFTVNLVKAALKSVNASDSFVKTVLVPLTAQDYSSQEAQATTGTDCILGNLGETTWPPFLTAMNSSGAKQRLYGAQGNLDGKVAKAFPGVTQGGVVAGSYSDISLPAWDDYRAAIKAYKAPTDEDYNSLGGLGTWAAYEVFKDLVSKMTGTVDAASFLAVAQKATVSFPGIAANVDFAVPFTGLGPTFKNAVNRNVTFDTIDNGVLKPFQDGKFYDMTNAMIGNPLDATNTPPGGK